MAAPIATNVPTPLPTQINRRAVPAPNAMTILLIGSSSREHASAKVLGETPFPLTIVRHVYVANGNAGTAAELAAPGHRVSNIDVNMHSNVALLDSIMGLGIDTVISAFPLDMQVVRILQQRRVKVSAPIRGQVEALKRQLKPANLPGDSFTIFGFVDGMVTAPVMAGENTLAACKKETDSCYLWPLPAAETEPLKQVLTIVGSRLADFRGIFSIEVLIHQGDYYVKDINANLGDLEAETLFPVLGYKFGYALHCCLHPDGGQSQLPRQDIQTNGLISVSLSMRLDPFHTDEMASKNRVAQYGIAMTAMTLGVNFPPEFGLMALPRGKLPHLRPIRKMNDTGLPELPYHIFHGATYYDPRCKNGVMPCAQYELPVFTCTGFASTLEHAFKVAKAVTYTPNFTDQVSANAPETVAGLSFAWLDMADIRSHNHQKAFAQAARGFYCVDGPSSITRYHGIINRNLPPIAPLNAAAQEFNPSPPAATAHYIIEPTGELSVPLNGQASEFVPSAEPMSGSNAVMTPPRSPVPSNTSETEPAHVYLPTVPVPAYEYPPWMSPPASPASPALPAASPAVASEPASQAPSAPRAELTRDELMWRFRDGFESKWPGENMEGTLENFDAHQLKGIIKEHGFENILRHSWEP